MTTVLISLQRLRRYLSFENFIILYFAISFGALGPGFLNLNQSWVPYGSINDSTSYGYQTSANYLHSIGISTVRNVASLPVITENGKLLAYLNPKEDISKLELEYLIQRISTGLPTLIVSDNLNSFPNFRNLLNQFFVAPTSCRMYEHVDQVTLNRQAYPSVFGQFAKFQGILPTALDVAGNSFVSPLLAVTQFNASCDSFADNNSTRLISVRTSSLIVLSDPWMITNNYTKFYPENLGFWNLVVNEFKSSLNIQITSMVSAEYHLNYAPMNRESLQITLEKNFQNVFLVFILSIFTVGFPILLGIIFKMFSFDRREGRGKQLKKRFMTLHTERLYAVPLTLEEKIITDEKIRVSISDRPTYLRETCSQLYDFIIQYKLEGYFNESLINELKDRTAATYVVDDVYWMTISKVNLIMDVLQEDTMISSGLGYEEFIAKPSFDTILKKIESKLSERSLMIKVAPDYKLINSEKKED